MFCNLLAEQLGQGCIVSSRAFVSPTKKALPPHDLTIPDKIRWKKAAMRPRLGQPALSGSTFNPDTCIQPYHLLIEYDLVFKNLQNRNMIWSSKRLFDGRFGCLAFTDFHHGAQTKYDQSNLNLECSSNQDCCLSWWTWNFQATKAKYWLNGSNKIVQNTAQKADFPHCVATDPESVGGGTQIVVYILAVTAVTQLALQVFTRIACIACIICTAHCSNSACPPICLYCLHWVLGAGNISAPRILVVSWLQVELNCKWRNLLSSQKSKDEHGPLNTSFNGCLIFDKIGVDLSEASLRLTRVG